MVFVAAMGAGHAKTLFGFTPFPYDATPEAVARTAEIARNNSSLYALHFDDGVPWEELMEGKPLPRKVQKEWDDLARAIPSGRPVYVGLSPLDKDRKSLAPAKSDKDKVSLPWSLRLAPLDDKKVKAAYLEYARRAVRQFKPTFLNIGIEAGEMASRDPKHWPQFEALYEHVRSALKREYPELKIGISFGLQSLRKPEVAKRAKDLVEDSDYLGLSFYPHASPFGERFGEPRLGDGEAAWREPLKWVRGYTSKPIALCETGYLSTTVTLKSFNLTLKGDQNLQTSYVRELAQTAERDQYLFVVWFLAVDYDKLYERMGSSPGNDVNLLWRNIGLWNGDVKPKPAWEEWKRAVAGSIDKAPPPGTATPPAEPKPSVPEREAAPSTPSPSAAEVGFTSERQLFQAGPGSDTVMDRGGTMRWSFEYKSSDWAWMLRDLGFALPPSASRMKLRLRSDRPGTLFVQLEESGGETFFAMIDPKDDWLDVNIDLKSLKADPAKRRDGVLQPEKIVKLLVADPAGRDKAQGHRTVWFQRWSFE
jgi:hypothetical protein